MNRTISTPAPIAMIGMRGPVDAVGIAEPGGMIWSIFAIHSAASGWSIVTRIARASAYFCSVIKARARSNRSTAMLFSRVFYVDRPYYTAEKFQLCCGSVGDNNKLGNLLL